jgi:hypothetical protein
MRVYHGVLMFCEEIIWWLNPVLMGHRTLCLVQVCTSVNILMIELGPSEFYTNLKLNC